MTNDWPSWSPERATLFAYCKKCETIYLDMQGSAILCPCDPGDDDVMRDRNVIKLEFAQRVVVGEPRRAQLNLARQWISEALSAPPADLKLALEAAGWKRAEP